MYVKTLSLKNYRNIKSLSIELNKGINIFYGKNAQGKTNILESIYMCSTGRSHRTNNDKELINFNSNEAYIKLFVDNESFSDKIDVYLNKSEKKGIAVNSIPIKKLGELFGKLHIVIFSPEDLQLVKLGPSERRRFIDMELCQLNKIYYHNLQQYYKVLKQRNKLLKSIQQNNQLIDTLQIWDEQLANYGVKVINERYEFIKKLNKISNHIHKQITNEDLRVEYSENVKAEELFNRLKKNKERDIYFSTTSAGPHKDDVLFFINDVNVRNFASQGQQRCVALSVKLAEIDIIKQERNITPVLLLDDVFSELDEERQKFLLKSVKDIQTIVTCTEVENIIKNFCEELFIFNVTDGKVTNI